MRHSPSPISSSHLFDGRTPATADYLYDLELLSETLSDILESGQLQCRPGLFDRRQRNSDGLITRLLTEPERMRWTAMLEEARSGMLRVQELLEASRSN